MRTIRNEGTSKLGLIVLLLVALGGVAGLAAYVKLGPADRSMEAAVREPDPVTRTGPQRIAHVPIPKFDNEGNLHWDWRSDAVPAGQDLKLAAVNAFLAEISDCQAERIRLSDGVATVEFADRTVFGFGSRDESTFLLGLRTALGRFPDVDAVDLHVGGQRLEELGHQDLVLPMPVIREGEPATPNRGAEHPPADPTAQTRPVSR